MTATAVSRFFPLLPMIVGGMAGERLLYEEFFPHLEWLNWPISTILLALLLAACGLAFWFRYASGQTSMSWLPLFLNLLYLFDPTVDVVRGRFLFAASLWLTAVLFILLTAKQHVKRNGLLLLWLLLSPVYLLTMSGTVGHADTFEFQVVAPQLGIAHPTGYPLYLLLGKVWTVIIPFGSVAWRLNVGTAVYALLAASLLYLAGLRLLRHPIPALLGAAALGLTPTFWSQAIAAEVYSLHACVVSGVLTLALICENKKLEMEDWRLVGMVFLVGLGLTNHLTTLFLLPPVALTLLFTNGVLGNRRYLSKLAHDIFLKKKTWLKLALAFLLPLTLYAYLPLRWAAVNGEAMGIGRFRDWVFGSRFQGALQWLAWLHDPARYAIMGRLLLDNWGIVNLVLIGIGLIYLIVRQWRAALLLFLAWFGFSFYALNYYVPDLAVFLMGAHVIMTIWWMAGAVALIQMVNFAFHAREEQGLAPKTAFVFGIQSLIFTLLFTPILLLSTQNWPQLDQSQDDGLTQWGTAVLNLPLASSAAILADSEKIAPLYYLQQAEGMRPDLDIMVLPDEAAYRAELDKRIAAGQTVYLARFLPGLEGVYHLRSLGPLTEVSTQPLTHLYPQVIPTQLTFDEIDMVGYALQPISPYGSRETAVTLYWQAAQPVTRSQYIYVRWQGHPPVIVTGQHAANNNYPTLAWDAGELVPDFYRLPHPISPITQTLVLQAALAPPFTPTDTLLWQTITTIEVPPTADLTLARPLRTQLGSVTLTGVQFPSSIRPQTPLDITLTGYGDPTAVQLSLQPITPQNGYTPANDQPVSTTQAQDTALSSPFAYATTMTTDVGNGRYALLAQSTSPARCGWLQPRTNSCVLGELIIDGAPLPDGATNFDDKIALLNVAISNTELQPGGQLQLALTWQALAAMPVDYTVFVQVLDSDDRIVGQVDAWPVQGTRPTSQWAPGDIIHDPYVVQLNGDMPPGQYRLIVGWYLLADLRRLPVLDDTGAPIADKFLVPGLAVP